MMALPHFCRRRQGRRRRDAPSGEDRTWVDGGVMLSRGSIHPPLREDRPYTAAHLSRVRSKRRAGSSAHRGLPAEGAKFKFRTSTRCAPIRRSPRSTRDRASPISSRSIDSLRAPCTRAARIVVSRGTQACRTASSYDLLDSSDHRNETFRGPRLVPFSVIRAAAWGLTFPGRFGPSCHAAGTLRALSQEPRQAGVPHADRSRIPAVHVPE